MFQKKTIYRYLILPALLFVGVAGCSDNSTGNEEIGYDATQLLQNESNNVIFQTYIDLDNEAGELVTAVNDLRTNITAGNLTAAQEQWQNTREPWELSESFLFGPVDSEGIDPAIDDWPLNRTDLDNVLSSGDELTKEYIDGLDTGLKGFHTIEYLLFGDNNSKTPGDFTDREFDYLIAATESLKGETTKLVTLWEAGGGDYTEPFVNSLANAGNGSEIYLSQKSAVEQLISGMEVIADEVANGKIADPYSQEDPNLVESQFSFNSKIDFQNNLRSIMNIYTGEYNGSQGQGISDFVSELDSDLDARFKNEIDEGITAIASIQGNFRDAITQNRDDVSNAQEAVRTVLATIQEDIKPLLDEF